METHGSWITRIMQLVLMFFVGHLVTAHEPSCLVHSQPDELTSYEINNIRIDCEAIEYSWNNVTDFVLAYPTGKDETLVVAYTNTSLVTSRCLEVIYKLNCMSGQTYIIRCVENCTQALETQQPNVKTHSDLVLGTVIIIIIIIVILVLVFSLVAALTHRRGNQEMPL